MGRVSPTSVLTCSMRLCLHNPHTMSSLRYRIKPNCGRVPPRGWHFIEQGERITGSTPDDVAEKLESIRIRHGRPVGDPMAEIVAYVAANWPTLVEKDLEAISVSPEEQMPANGLGDAVLGFLHRQAHLPHLGTVAKELQGERAKTCLACPHHTPHGADGKLKDEIERRSYLLRQGQTISGLSCCTHHKWDARVAVRLTGAAMEKVAGPVAEGCWAAQP